MRKRHVTRFC